MNSLLMQGDIALRKVANPNKEGVAVKNGVIAEGEHTGHAHVVTGDAKLVKIEGRMYVVTGPDKSKVEHLKNLSFPADHKALELEPSTYYEVLLQNEYNPYEMELQRVAD